MTDRHAGYIVVLDRDIRDDDAKATLDAIRQIKGVLEVQPVVADMMGAIASSRVRYQFADALSDAIRKVLGFSDEA